MSNSPGKKDKAAVWVKRQDGDREAALHAYILERHPDYAGWLKRRNAHRRDLWKTADRRYPQKRATPEMLRNRQLYIQLIKENAALERRKKAWLSRQARAWDKAHPTPLSWEKRQELEAEFAKRYVPTDRS